MSNDIELKQAVLAALQWEPGVKEAHIGVTAKDGIITLSGFVEGYAEKLAAERAARRVSDVKAVAEEIEVRLPSSVKHGDQEIAAAAIERLRWDSVIPQNAIKVKVENGRVTLAGEVDWRYQFDAAAADVHGLWGVTGLFNQITIKPKSNAADIRDSIMVALQRSRVDPKAITVSVQDGKVKLSGTVDSWDARDFVSSTAWAAPGTVSVESHVTVL